MVETRLYCVLKDFHLLIDSSNEESAILDHKRQNQWQTYGDTDVIAAGGGLELHQWIWQNKSCFGGSFIKSYYQPISIAVICG